MKFLRSRVRPFLVYFNVRRNFNFPEIVADIWEVEDEEGIELVLEQFGPERDGNRPIYAFEDALRGLRPKQIRYLYALFDCGGDRYAAAEKAGYSPDYPLARIEGSRTMQRAVGLIMQRVMGTLSITLEHTMARLSRLATRAEEDGDYKAAVAALKTLGEFQGLGKNDEEGGSIRIDNHGQMIVFAGQGAGEDSDPKKQGALDEILRVNQILPSVTSPILFEEPAGVLEGEYVSSD